MLLGIGKVPGLIAVCVYAMPPIVRLTNLGLRLVDKEILEAADAFGSNYRQRLFKVQLPLALPNIFAGVNQTIMMAFAMVVIASMIGTRGARRSSPTIHSEPISCPGHDEWSGNRCTCNYISTGFPKNMANAYSATGKAAAMSDYKIEIKNLYKIFGPDDKNMVELVANGLGKQELLDQTSACFGFTRRQYWYFSKFYQCNYGAVRVWKIDSNKTH